MSTAMFVEQEPRPAPCYGVDVDGDGSLVVAKHEDGATTPAWRYPAGAVGAEALKARLARSPARTRVCIASSSAAALGIAVALMPLSSVEVTLIAPCPIAYAGRDGLAPVLSEPGQRAETLARLARRLI